MALVLALDASNTSFARTFGSGCRMLVAVAAIGCTSSSSAPTTPPDASLGGDAAGATFEAGPGAVDSDSGPGTQPFDAGSTPDATVTQTMTGQISLSTSVNVEQTQFVNASFFNSITTSTVQCQITGAGSCTYQVCTGQRVSNPTPESAGLITFTGGLVPDGGVTIGPDSDGDYLGDAGAFSAPYTGFLWSPDGGTISVRAQGAAVPAFAGTIVGPGDVTITSPATILSQLTSPVSLTIDRAKDFVFAWTPGTPGTQLGLTLTPTSTPAGQPIGQIGCAFDAASGTGTIPGSLLGDLVGPTAAFVATPFSSSTIDAGAYAVTLSASAWSLTAQVQLQ